MAAAVEEKATDEITIMALDSTLGERLVEQLVDKGIIRKSKKDSALEVINGLGVKQTKVPKQLAANKPNRDATLIKKLVPFTGVCIDGKCHALNNNHGLFNQCDKVPQTNSSYCKACQSPNGTSGLTKIQSCGTVELRMQQYEKEGDINKYKTPTNDVKNKDGVIVTKNGVWSKSIGKVLEDINKKRDVPIERQQIEAVAEQLGVEIPEVCWDVPVTKRGRKVGSKNSSKASTPATSDDEKPKKKGKAPKKEEVKKEEVKKEDGKGSWSEDQEEDDANKQFTEAMSESDEEDDE